MHPRAPRSSAGRSAARRRARRPPERREIGDVGERREHDQRGRVREIEVDECDAGARPARRRDDRRRVARVARDDPTPSPARRAAHARPAAASSATTSTVRPRGDAWSVTRPRMRAIAAPAKAQAGVASRTVTPATRCDADQGRVRVTLTTMSPNGWRIGAAGLCTRTVARASGCRASSSSAITAASRSIRSNRCPVAISTARFAASE